MPWVLTSRPHQSTKNEGELVTAHQSDALKGLALMRGYDPTDFRNSSQMLMARANWLFVLGMGRSVP